MNNKFLNNLFIAVGMLLIPIILGGMFSSCVMKNTENQIIVAIVSKNADVESVKAKIEEIEHVKKVTIEYREEQWSDIPEDLEGVDAGILSRDKVKIKVDKQKNLDEVYEKVMEKDYIDNAKYFPDTEVFDNVGKVFKYE